MTAYILGRLLLIVPTLFGILLINFALVQFMPGGPIEQVLAQVQGDATGPLDRIAGIAYRNADGETAQTLPRPVIADLDALPFPAWDFVDRDRYRAIWGAHHGYYSMNLATTRGCPFHCNWCAKPIWGQRYNSRSPENAAEELLFLKQKFNPDHIWFADDILGLKPGWLPAFAAAVDRLDARIPFKSLSRVDLLLRPGETEALARAGAIDLPLIRRDLRRSEVRRALAEPGGVAGRAGVEVHCVARRRSGIEPSGDHEPAAGGPGPPQDGEVLQAVAAEVVGVQRVVERDPGSGGAEQVDAELSVLEDLVAADRDRAAA